MAAQHGDAASIRKLLDIFDNIHHFLSSWSFFFLYWRSKYIENIPLSDVSKVEVNRPSLSSALLSPSVPDDHYTPFEVAIIYGCTAIAKVCSIYSCLHSISFLQSQISFVNHVRSSFIAVLLVFVSFLMHFRSFCNMQDGSHIQTRVKFPRNPAVPKYTRV